MSAFRPRFPESLAYGSGEAALSPMSFRRDARASLIRLLPGGLVLGHANAIVKRTADIVLALVGLLLMGLPMLAVAAIIRLSSPGPALFQQQRIGFNGCRFVMLKFRTMRHMQEHPGICPQATRDDPRVTWIGRLLRRTSFDELPQLLNVLSGSMSLVGPRPHAPGTCAAGKPFELISRHYDTRHCVRPGMTGLAQIRGWRGETDTEEKLLRRIDSDLEYIRTWSLSRDLTIIGRTIITVLRMPNAY